MATEKKLFPIIIKKLEIDDSIPIEDIVLNYYKKDGYKEVGYENEPIYDLFFHLCFEIFLLKPNWSIWDKNKTLKDYPKLTDHLNIPFDSKEFTTYRDWVMKYFSKIPLGWMFSDECLKLNGNYLLFPNGVYYQIFKKEIDKFLKYELPNKDIASLMVKNYKKIEILREKYTTLFAWGGRENIEPLKIIYNNIPYSLLRFILTKLFENFIKYRTGFPDCWMWNKKLKQL